LIFWRKWVGLPWSLGADPRSGRAACCFRTAQAAREALGLSWPADRMERWYAAARRGDWRELREDWDRMTDPINRPEPGALIRFDHDDSSFGVGVLADEQTMITVRHHGRLIVGRLSAFSKLNLYCLK
jgi:hypothetical protein